MKLPAKVIWCAAVLLGAWLLGGCLPASQSQFDEEKEPHYLAGKNRVNGMDFPGAVESFQKALEVNPHSASAHFELGWLNDQKQSDPAAAIYHYNQYLRLRPRAINGEMVNARMLACKQELARTVSLGAVTLAMQKEFEQLAEENRRLKGELEQLKAYAAQLQALTNRPPQITIIHPGTGGTSVAPLVRNQGGGLGTNVTSVPGRSGSRTHTVQSGETATKIARAYGVRVDALLGANPGLDAKKMKVGQTILVPAAR